MSEFSTLGDYLHTFLFLQWEEQAELGMRYIFEHTHGHTYLCK